MGNIYIYSEPKDSGKTLAVMNWLHKKPREAGGFLVQAINGKLKLYNIATEQYSDFEKEATNCPDHTLVGGLALDNAIFNYGRQLLLGAAENWPKWLIIDSVCSLELENKGWEPALSAIIKRHDDTDSHCDILLIVCADLLEQVITHYNLHAAIVLDKRFFML